MRAQKIGCKIYITQPVTVVEVDDSEREESWLIAEGQLATPESRAS